MSISDVLSRVSAIEQQLQQLSSGTLLDSVLGGGSAAAAGGAGVASAGAGADRGSVSSSDAGSSSTDFADALAQAQEGAAPAAATTGDSSASNTESALLSALLSGGSSPASGASAGLASSGSATLPPGACTLLTSDQQQFASTLSAETGLSPSVVSAWLLAEESGSAAQSRQAQGNNDWLNVGYTDSATYGASDSVWSDPTTAATATAQWLAGQDSIPGYGSASGGVQAILSSVGDTPAAQIQAIQQSGWSSGGYPSLAGIYSEIAQG